MDAIYRLFIKEANCLFSFFSVILISVLVMLLTSCSSAPKRSVEILTIRNQAVSELNLGNTYILNGNTALADDYFSNAYKKAMSVDDINLVCSIIFSRISAAIDAGQSDEAQQLQKQAAIFSLESGNEALSAVAGLYLAQIYLYQVNLIQNQQKQKTTVEEPARKALALGQAAIPFLKKDPFNMAFAWRIQGEAQRSLEQWKEAEKAYSEAAAIHTKNRFIIEIGQDWYLIAQVRALSGDTDGGLQALNKAILYDRDAENSTGLGMDYLAAGILFEKMNRTNDARFSWERSRDIFTAAEMQEGTNMAIEKLNTLVK